jgi:hypothetical protein
MRSSTKDQAEGRFHQMKGKLKPEVQIKEKETKNGNDTDRYFNTRLGRRNTHLAPQ